MSGHTALVYTRRVCEASSIVGGAVKADTDSKAGSSRGASRGAADSRGGGGKGVGGKGGGKGGEKGGKGKGAGRAGKSSKEKGESAGRDQAPTGEKQTDAAVVEERLSLGREGRDGVEGAEASASVEGAAPGMELEMELADGARDGASAPGMELDVARAHTHTHTHARAAPGMELDVARDLALLAYDAGRRGRSAGAREQGRAGGVGVGGGGVFTVGKRKADETSGAAGREGKRRGGGGNEHEK